MTRTEFEGNHESTRDPNHVLVLAGTGHSRDHSRGHRCVTLCCDFAFEIEGTVLGFPWPAIPLLGGLGGWRHSTRRGSGDSAGALRVQFGPSRRHFHRHGRDARRVPRRHARGAHALRRTGPGSLRRAPGVLRTACPRPTDAFASAPQAGWNGQRYPARRGCGRRSARRLSPRDLSGRCRRGRRAQHDGRIVPHRRTVCVVQGRGVGRAVRGHQRRRRADDPRGKNGRRFAVCQDHAGDARVGTAPAQVAATRRPDRRHLHAARGGHRPDRLGCERRCPAIPGRAGGRHAVPASHRHPGGDHRFRFSGGPARHHHQRPGRAGKDRHLPHGDLRQDRHAHLRAAEVDGSSSRRGLHRRRSAGRGRKPGAILAPSAGGRDHRRRRPSRSQACGSRGSERATGRRASRHHRRPGGASDEPEEARGSVAGFRCSCFRHWPAGWSA